MAKKEYAPTEYADLLEWTLRSYAQIERPEGDTERLVLRDVPMNLWAGGAEVSVWQEGRLYFCFEAAVREDTAQSFDVLSVLNRINSNSGVTFFLKEGRWGMLLCAREEMYMDHLTQTAAKRTARRVMAAVLDVCCALDHLCAELPEYFSKEILEEAAQQQRRDAEDWPEEYFAAGEAEQDMTGGMQEWTDEDEELPF